MQFARSNARRAEIIKDARPGSSATQIAASLSALIIVLSLFLAARRILGAMAAPLAPLPLAITAIVLLLCVLCVRLTLRPSTSGPAVSRRSSFPRLIERAPFISLVLVAFACSYPGGRFIDWLIWLPAIAAAWFALTRIKWQGPQQSPVLRLHESAPSPLPEPTELVLQQLTRFRTAGGQDAIRGTLMAEFAAGQRAATLYVGFCPPFARLPETETDIADADLATVHLVQVLHNGAQLEVRLPRPATHAIAVAVEFFAAEPASA
jgi:hypothetical protein